MYNNKRENLDANHNSRSTRCFVDYYTHVGHNSGTMRNVILNCKYIGNTKDHNTIRWPNWYTAVGSNKIVFF